MHLGLLFEFAASDLATTDAAASGQPAKYELGPVAQIRDDEADPAAPVRHKQAVHREAGARAQVQRDGRQGGPPEHLQAVQNRGPDAR